MVILATSKPVLRCNIGHRVVKQKQYEITAKTQRESARNAEMQARVQANPSPVLTTSRASLVETSSSLANSAKKVKKIVNGPSLYDRVFTTENLEKGCLVISAAAITAAIGTWASQVGTLTASQIVATNMIAFFKPGITVVGFALKTGMFITMNAFVPIATGLVTISLPIVSTIVVTGIAVLLILHVVNQMIQKLEESVKSGLDTAAALPGKLLEQVPGYSTISALLGYGKAAPSKEETEEPIVLPRKKQQRNASENTPKNTPRGLETLLDDFNVEAKQRPHKRPPHVFTRRDFLRNKKAAGE